MQNKPPVSQIANKRNAPSNRDSRLRYILRADTQALPLTSRESVQRSAYLQMSNTLDFHVRLHGQFLYGDTGSALAK